MIGRSSTSEPGHVTGGIDLTVGEEARVRNQADDRLGDDEWLVLRDAETLDSILQLHIKHLIVLT